MMPRTIPEWLAAIAVLISAAWLYATPDYEPSIAFISCVLAFVGMRSRTSVSASTSTSLPKLLLSSESCAQFNIKSLLVGAYQSDRLSIARDNLNHILPVSPGQLPSILGLFYQSDRLTALKLLSQKLAAHPDPKETENILGTLYASDRAAGAKSLVMQVASNITVERDASPQSGSRPLP